MVKLTLSFPFIININQLKLFYKLQNILNTFKIAKYIYIIMVNYFNTLNNCIDLKIVFNHSNVYATRVPKLIYNKYL